MRPVVITLLLLLTVCGVAAAQSNQFLYTYHGNVWEDGSFGTVGSVASSVGQVDSLTSFLFRGDGCTWTYYLTSLVAQTVTRNGNLVTVCYSSGTIEVHEDCVNSPAYCYGSTTPPSDC